MPPNPVVSVVTIFLNEERFLEEAIASVLTQTYDSWELLLVDDGSTDESTEIARRYAAAYPDRIRYLDHDGHQNRGMSATRNLGFRHADGRYVALLDADDVWEPDKLAGQVALMEAYPQAGMVCSATRYWRSWAGVSEEYDVVVPVGAPAEALIQPQGLMKMLYPLGEGAAPCLCGMLLRRTVIEELGGFEEHFRGFYEDQAFLAKLYLRTPVYVSSACWDRYRQHPASCVAQVADSGKYHEVRSYFLEWLEGYLRAEGMEGTEVWRLLRRALRPYRYPKLVEALNRVRRLGRAVCRHKRRMLSRLVSRAEPST